MTIYIYIYSYHTPYSQIMNKSKGCFYSSSCFLFLFSKVLKDAMEQKAQEAAEHTFKPHINQRSKEIFRLASMNAWVDSVGWYAGFLTRCFFFFGGGGWISFFLFEPHPPPPKNLGKWCDFTLFFVLKWVENGWNHLTRLDMVGYDWIWLDLVRSDWFLWGARWFDVGP